MKKILSTLIGAGFLVACQPQTQVADQTGAGAVLFTAKAVVPMTGEGDTADAVLVRNGLIVDVGQADALRKAYPGLTENTGFKDKVILPGLIDPHMHLTFAGMMYAQPFAPPWPMVMPGGMSEGYPGQRQFLDRLKEIIEEAPNDGSPVIVYGYHNLLQGDLDRTMLDEITSTRPLIVWHYSGHDFYLNSAALNKMGDLSKLAILMHGVDQTPEGELTGRLYENAAFLVLSTFQNAFMAPDLLTRGTDRYFSIIRQSGITTSADMAYGAFGRPVEDATIAANWSIEDDHFRLYLVPEYRAFLREFRSAAPKTVVAMANGVIATPAPVLPRVKYFTDAAFYSQTMRLSPPGYLSGQSEGSEGLWVLEPEEIAPTIEPFAQEGLAVHIHSNGDAAQSATLNALRELRGKGLNMDFVIEHGGLFSPEQIAEAAELKANISAASHYVYYLSHAYQGPLGPARANWITPLGGLSEAGATVAVHSDAPLAPPIPLKAAAAHVTRLNREGEVYAPQYALSPYDALEAVTLDAARVLGLDNEIGSLAPGKKADFTILGANPLDMDAKDWTQIPVWGVVLEGNAYPIE